MGRSGFGMGIGVVLIVVDSNDKYTKRRNVSKLRASPDQSQDPSIISTNAKRHVPRAMLNDTYILPSPIKPSSIHAKRRRRRRRRRRRDVVWS